MGKQGEILKHHADAAVLRRHVKPGCRNQLPVQQDAAALQFLESGRETLIDVGDYLHKRREALLAHRTQVDPNGFWMRLPDDVIREVFPWEEFTLARSLVDVERRDGEFEDDLFAGIRTVERSQ